MSLSLNLRGLASRLLSRPTATATSTTQPLSSFSARCTAISPITPAVAPAAFSTTSMSASGYGGGAKTAKAKGGKKKGGQERDPKMINMLKHLSILSPRRIPPPLRMARNRHLRHWTIHRAWLLFRRREREQRERTLMRQYQSMSAACEALRLTDGPGTRDQGYLYRVAMEKKGVYGHNGVPIEYARPLTDTPARSPWNHDWKP
ncbi:hypothetical protein B0T17DRAFT_508962 [Bombardia bombarda]|uniref:Large ribosomal subunit protein mL40 n=1 Tax=Bombardia bombarda TaxID=252184 RepID=A0AA39WU28_9PEZI|nr:hypothetical protein B0T17DRAFT_508962 [Bombardia bombarda]